MYMDSESGVKKKYNSDSYISKRVVMHEITHEQIFVLA